MTFQSLRSHTKYTIQILLVIPIVVHLFISYQATLKGVILGCAQVPGNTSHQVT